MTTDTYLQDAAKAMLAADRSGHSVVPVLERLCPHIVRQLRDDARRPDLLALWGRSCNVDENAGQVIVPEPILHAIGKLAGVPMRGRFVHAGLEHTYGYLFSLIDTPYGTSATAGSRPTWRTASDSIQRCWAIGRARERCWVTSRGSWHASFFAPLRAFLLRGGTRRWWRPRSFTSTTPALRCVASWSA